MSRVPAVPAGVFTVQVVCVLHDMPVIATPPILIAVTPMNEVPVMVTRVPPALGPDAGLIALTCGAGLTPVPVTGTTVGPKLLVRPRMAFTAPPVTGVNDSVMEHDAPGSNVRHGSAVPVAAEMPFPNVTAALPVAMVVGVHAIEPVLVIVRVRVAVVPTGTLPNATVDGEIARFSIGAVTFG